MYNNSAKGYFVNELNSLNVLTLVSAVFTNIRTINLLANDSQVLDGKAMNVKLIADISKTLAGNTTMEFQITVGGLIFLLPQFTLGGAIILPNTNTLEIDLFINFRTGNSCNVMAKLTRNGLSGNITLLTVKSAGTFNKTINNDISVGARIVATPNTVSITTQQLQALIF